MANDQQVDAGSGADRITDLCDDVLHIILARLPTTDEAARTSVLSRRWRRVWTGVPAPSFRYGDAAPSSSSAQQDPLDRIDAALSGHAATTTIDRLEIAVSCGVPDARVARWLQFASERLDGELRLALPSNTCNAKEAAIPLCERVTSISLCLDRTLRFPSHSAGAFTALVALELTTGYVDGGELESTLSSRCPHLKKLALEGVKVLHPARPVGAGGLCIRSDSLEQLKIIANTSLHGLIKVATPELKSLFLNVCCNCNHNIIAPKLSELDWYCYYYHPGCHRFEDVPRHLRRLRVATIAPGVMTIMRRFDTIHELNLVVFIPVGSGNYKRFLQDMNHFTKCEVLVLTITCSVAKHAFKQTMLSILAKCAGLRKLIIKCPVYITDKHSSDWSERDCQLELPQTLKIDNTALYSLKQVEIKHNGGYTPSKMAELVELLCACIGHFGKEVPITIIEN